MRGLSPSRNKIVKSLNCPSSRRALADFAKACFTPVVKPIRHKLPARPSTESSRRIGALRLALLRLHKQQIESEKRSYEATVGTIQSPGHFLQLLTSDPWFLWLRPLSQLIVAIDEAEDSREPLTEQTVQNLIARTQALLVASETGEGFSPHYFEAIQRDPDVVFAHAEVARFFPPRASSPPNVQSP